MARTKPPSLIPALRTHVIDGFSSYDAKGVLWGVHLGCTPGFANYPSIHRIRITAEVIDEPDEVLAARVVELWETQAADHHHPEDLQRLAAHYGAVLVTERRGCRAEREFLVYLRNYYAPPPKPGLVDVRDYSPPFTRTCAAALNGTPLYLGVSPGTVAVARTGECWYLTEDDWTPVVWESNPE